MKPKPKEQSCLISEMNRLRNYILGRGGRAANYDFNRFGSDEKSEIP